MTCRHNHCKTGDLIYNDCDVCALLKGEALVSLIFAGDSPRFSPAFHSKPTNRGLTNFTISNSSLHPPLWCGIMISSCL